MKASLVLFVTLKVFSWGYLRNQQKTVNDIIRSPFSSVYASKKVFEDLSHTLKMYSFQYIRYTVSNYCRCKPMISKNSITFHFCCYFYIYSIFQKIKCFLWFYSTISFNSRYKNRANWNILQWNDPLNLVIYISLIKQSEQRSKSGTNTKNKVQGFFENKSDSEREKGKKNRVNSKELMHISLSIEQSLRYIWSKGFTLIIPCI